METYQKYVQLVFPCHTLPSCSCANLFIFPCQIELKETHLAPLTQTFTRSSSTSTIKGEPNEDTAPTPTVATPNPDGISMNPYNDLPNWYEDLVTNAQFVEKSCL